MTLFQMGVDVGRLKRHATIATSILLLVAFALGILAFALALRPCRLQVPPGMVVDYTLTTTTCALDESDHPGQARVETRQVELVGTGAENEVALISPSADGDARHDEVCLMDLAPDGAAFRLDAAARPLDMGVALGFFDFNLMPLPEGSEQPRDVQINYAVAPARRNPVLGRVRRAKSGAKPEFRMALQPSVEWVTDEGYHQVRDLVATYRFNTALGVVDRATIDLIAGVERPDGRHRYQVRMALELAHEPTHLAGDPRQVRESVLASAQAQALLDVTGAPRSTSLAQQLRQADISLPSLRGIADHLSQAILRPEPPVTTAWCLCVAQGPLRELADAQALAQRLAAASFPSHLVREDDDTVAVLVGPYPSQDPGVLDAVARRFPQFSPRWMPAP